MDLNLYGNFCNVIFAEREAIAHTNNKENNNLYTSSLVRITIYSHLYLSFFASIPLEKSTEALSFLSLKKKIYKICLSFCH